MKNDVFKMKKSIGYTNEADIDERIATIEFKLWTESVPLKDEKKYLQEIQELKRNRPKVSQVHNMEKSMESYDKGTDLKKSLDQLYEEKNAEFAKKKEVQKELEAQ